MFFLNPIWLWGLAALTVPVAIHFLSRKESDVMKLGSLRHLQESITKQSVNIRLNEWVLLALRCLLIILIVLLLAGLHLTTKNVAHERWLLVEKGLEQDSEFVQLIDSLENTGFKLKPLHKGFADAADTNATDNYWKLVEDIQRYSPEQVIVLSNSRIENFKGKRVAKPKQLTWLTKDSKTHQFPLQAIPFKIDSVSIRTGSTSTNRTSFKDLVILSTMLTDSIALDTRDTVHLLLASDITFAYDKKIMLASLRSLDIQDLPMLVIDTVATSLSQSLTADWLVWLSNNPLPEGVHANTLVMASVTQEHVPLLSQQKDCRDNYACWTITRRLTVDEAYQHKLAWELSKLLFKNSRANLAKRTNMNDYRVQPESMMWSKNDFNFDNNNIMESGPSTLLQVLAAMLLIVLLIERLLAFHRHQ